MLEKRLQQGKRGFIALGNARVPAMAIVVAATEQPGANRIRAVDQARGGAAFQTFHDAQKPKGEAIGIAPPHEGQ